MLTHIGCLPVLVTRDLPGKKYIYAGVEQQSDVQRGESHVFANEIRRFHNGLIYQAERAASLQSKV